jgi:hypothetical protein
VGEVAVFWSGLKWVEEQVVADKFGKAGVGVLSTAIDISFSNYGWYGGRHWGTWQFPHGDPGPLNSVDWASFWHDVHGRDLQWAKDVWRPTGPGIPTGPFGLLYGAIGTGPFALAGLFQNPRYPTAPVPFPGGLVWMGGMFGSKRAYAFAFLLCAMLGMLSACSPMYVFTFRPRVAQASRDLPERLEKYLVMHGFKALGRSDVLTGELGCGQDAPNRTTFEREWYYWGYIRVVVIVHQFHCDSVWYVVILTREGDTEAAALRDALCKLFAPEIQSGAMRLKGGWRIQLE